LLDKAAKLQTQFADRGFVPVLVARRLQYLSFRMAQELGFRCFYFGYQPILNHSDCPDEALVEVVRTLGYDNVKGTGPHEKIADGFRRLATDADALSQEWSRSADVVGRFSQDLRDPGRIGLDRAALVREFHQACADELGCTGPWLGERVLATIDDDPHAFEDYR